MRGALWLLAAAFAFSALNGVIKLLGEHIHAFEIAFFRSLFGLLLLSPFLVRSNFGVLSTHRVLLHLARVGFGMVTMLCSFYAMTRLQLATAMSLFFANALFMIPLAVVLLKETVPWPRWAATVVGFGGVLLVLHPGMSVGDGGGEGAAAMSIDPAMLVAVLAALSGAVVMATVKMLSTTEKPVTVMLWFAVAGVPVTLVPALPVWVWPTPVELGWLFLTGVLGSAGQYWLIRGYRIGEATVITPFNYFQLLFTAAIGYVAFAEIPTAWTWAGAAVIVGANLYLVGHDRRDGDGRPTDRDP